MIQPNKTAPLFLSAFLGTVILAGTIITTRQPLTAQTPTPQPSPTPTKPPFQEILPAGEVRSLPGQLDQMPLFSSNSPEWIKTEGILLSTFPTPGKKAPAAHLNFPFQGRFNLFAHHFTHTPKDLQTLYIGVIVQNPGTQPVTVDLLHGASYLMEPDAPFQNKPPLLENPKGEIYSGPGIRAVDTVLRDQRQAGFPKQLVIPAGQSRMLLNHAIAVKGLARPVNGRSTFMRLNSSGRVYVASLAMFAKKNADQSDRAPTLQEWQQLLNNGGFAGPRDKTPTPPNQTSGALVYGRVAGVQQGSTWVAQLVDRDSKVLNIPAIGRGISYPLSTLRGGRLGSGQIQAATLLKRYPDTAYESHGNYGVHYDLRLPLKNPTNQPRTIAIALETPLKEDVLSKGVLRFRQPPQDFPFFRGTVRVREVERPGQTKVRYLHLWQRTGQRVEPLTTINLAPGEERFVRVDFLYPPDATPPQALTVRTLN